MLLPAMMPPPSCGRHARTRRSTDGAGAEAIRIPISRVLPKRLRPSARRDRRGDPAPSRCAQRLRADPLRRVAFRRSLNVTMSGLQPRIDPSARAAARGASAGVSRTRTATDTSSSAAKLPDRCTAPAPMAGWSTFCHDSRSRARQSTLGTSLDMRTRRPTISYPPRARTTR